MGLLSGLYTFVDGATPSAANWNTNPLAIQAILNGSVDQDNITTSGAKGICDLAGAQTIAGAKTFSAAIQANNTVTVGVDDTGYDVKFFGATSGDYWLWDESADALIMTDGVKQVLGHTEKLDTAGGNTQNALQIWGTAAATSRLAVGRFSADANGPIIELVKSRNATPTDATGTIVQDNDSVGGFRWHVDDGADLSEPIAQMFAEVDDGTPAENAVGGAWALSTADTSGTMTERMRIDSSGYIIAGHTAPITFGDRVPTYQTHSTTDGGFGTIRWQDGTAGPTLNFGKSRSAVIGTPGIITSGDVLGRIKFHGDDGVDFAQLAAEIRGVNEGTPAADDIAGALVFMTSAGSAASPSERLRIDSSGKVGIGTASPSGTLEVETSSGGTLINNISTASSAAIYAFRAKRSGASELIGSLDGYWRGSSDTDTLVAQMRVLSGADTTNYDDGRIQFLTAAAGTATVRMEITQDGDVEVGTAAIGTTATAGFLNIPTCAGTPTGTPTPTSGLAPLVVDSTNNKLYFYSGGAWRDAGP